MTASAAACSSLLPAEWREGVAGASLPAGDTVGDWVAFGDAQIGKLDQANGRTRDAAAVKRASRPKQESNPRWR